MEIRALEGVLRALDKEKPQSKGGGFVEELKNFINWVNEEQEKAEGIKEAVLRGEDIPLHQMVIEFEKANVALNLLIQVRNKLVEAFQELNRMQV
jgi:flagellar hook-basal body complex protein FliE